ncbi:unnamed protein product, partial [Closterium sp. NIES-53]
MPTDDGVWGADAPDETTWGETPAERDARLLAEAEQRVADMEILDSGRLVGVFHTFTLDSGASRSFFRDRTTLTPLGRPVAVSLADPSGGPVLASFSTVLPCPAAPSGTLSGLYLPSFSTNLVSGANLQDQGVDQFTPASQRVTHCTCARTGRHLATFTRRQGSSLYTLSTDSPPVPASGQVVASSQVFAAASGSGPESAPCSCRLLSHQTLLWHHRLGHPSLPRLRGIASRVLVSGLPRSLPPLPLGPAPTCVLCVEGRQRAAPHSSEFPPTEAPLQTLHMDVWGPARVRGQGHERYFLLVVDDYSSYTTVFPLRSKGDVTEVLIDWIRAARLQLRESFGSDFPVLRLHSDRGGEFSSALLGAFCRAQGIRQTFTLPASPQQNGIAERRIGMVMDVARTSMIHAAAPHFLWPFAVQYGAHQLNLQPRVSLPETSPTLRWTGKVGDASAFRVWGSWAFVRDLSADKLSPRAIPCVFLGFPPDTPGWQFYHPTSRRVLVPYYHLFPYRTALLPPPPLFLAPGPPQVDPLLPQGPALSGVSQVDAVEPIEVAVDSGAARGAEPVGAGSEGAESGGAEPVGAGSGGAESGGVEPGGAEPVGAGSGGAESGGVEPGGAEPGGAEPGGAEPGGAAPGGAESTRVASGGASSRRELLSPQEMREWFARRWSRAARGGGSPVAPGLGGARTSGTGVVGTGGAAAAAGVGPAGASGAAGAGATGGVGAGVGATGASGATGAGAAGGVDTGVGPAGGTARSAGGSGAAGPAGVGAVGAGGAADTGAATGGTGAVPFGTRGPARPRPYFVPLLEQILGLPPSPGPAPPLECPPPVQSQSPLQPVSPLPAPSPYAGPTGGLAERREPASCPTLPVRTARTSRRAPRPRPSAVPGTHQMTLRPSTAPLRIPLPSPPASSLPVISDPASDSLRAASPTVARLLSTVVTDPSFESKAASALVAELVDFAARCRLDYAASLVAESASVCPPSVGGECALSTDVLEDRQEFQCFAAALPHLVSTLIAPEGDPDAPDIPTPRSYAEAIEGPYSSQWQSAMDAEMASWKVKQPPGSSPVFKARYVARGFSQRQGVDYFHTFSPTPKMTTLRVLLHVAAQRDYELHSLDFSTAFLQGSLHEEIWLRRPPGFTGSFPPGTQWSFRRPVYGLCQAPREWHDTLRTTLAALGFAPSTADLSLFLRTDTSLPPFYVLVYIDDLVFATADTAGLARVKFELQKRHTCTDLGELRSYLGLQITRDRAQRTITLTQSHMVQQVLQCFDFTYSSPQATPLSTRHSLSALPLDESVESSGQYPELVGCLMYLMTSTRPDLAYPLSILAHYVAPGRHRPEHMAAAKRVLRYLCSTSGLGLVLGRRRPVVLTGHADASWVDNQAMQRSSQGYTFSLGSGSVSWRSTRSSSVLGSSCEAEIYAGAMAAQELRWLTYLLADLGEPPRSPPVLYVDNKAMLALCREHRLEHRTKHIALRYFLAHELQQRGQLRLAYVASEANTADIFTKALPPGDHQRFCTMLACFALLDWSCDLLFSPTLPMGDPAVIMCVSWGDYVLLGRQSRWPQGRYSVLAGFVEVGEAFEMAVVREVWEEARVHVHPDTVRDSKAVVVEGSATIPASITNLAALQYLDLTNEQLVGPIPSLASLSKLTLLAIGTDGSQLTGTYEGLAWLSSLSNLQSLNLFGLAEFTGSLSSLHVVSYLEKLQSLTLKSLTNATGEIPRAIRYLTALTALDLSYLRALEFPAWVTHLSILQYLNMNADEPRRQGLLSDDFSHLIALTSLSLSGNNLDGYVPKSFSSLLNLQYLALSFNHLQGTIPATLSALTALTAIDLSWNYLSGSIPRVFTTNIQSIALGYNAFSGAIPPHLALPQLSALQLSSNGFTGSIPSTFTRLTAMNKLDAANNSLSGGLDVVAQMIWLTDISLHTNNFSGVLPAALSAINGLTAITIANNHFTGEFPQPLLQTHHLAVLDVSNNSLSKSIPLQLTELLELVDINLNDNSFHGSIPSGLFHLPMLYSL